MKKILLTCALALVASGISMRAETRLGATVGVNYNELHFGQTDIFSTDRMPGGSVGLMGELMIPGIGFGVDASLLYSMRNAKLHFEEEEEKKTHYYDEVYFVEEERWLDFKRDA